MGYLLKEALKTLCGVNQWSYAVFWKIGCENPKLLIWEECYYESIRCSALPHISGIDNPELAFEDWEACWISADARTSQLGVQAEDKVHSLINKMMMGNQVNIVGEGLVGRAAFTGNHQWILSENYAREAHPPEVLNEVCQQFSAGMQTVAVIPVLTHGVVQLGSFLTIMENVGFVKDVKTLILQLGGVPGALLSDNYATKEPAPKIGVPICLRKSVSANLCGNYKVKSSKPFNADSCNQQSILSQAPGVVGQPSNSLIRQIQDNMQSAASTFQTPNLAQSLVKSHDDLCQPKVTPMMKPDLPFRSQLVNRVRGAEMITLNPEVWLNQQGSLYIPRSGFDQQPCVGPSSANFSSWRSIEEQILSDAGVQEHANDSLSASSGFMTSQLRTNGGLISSSHKDSVTKPLPEATQLQNGKTSHLRSISNPCSLPNAHRSGNSMSSIEQIPSFLHDSQNHDYRNQSPRSRHAKFEDACLQPPSGDDLFDILGVDFKNKLLSGSWNKFINNGPDSTKTFGRNNSTYMNLQDAGSDFYSVDGGNSDSGIFSVIGGTDHLLDAVVSRGHSAAKQSSDDNVSCRTTLTKISSSSVPNASPSYGQVSVSNQMQGELFGLPKSLAKAGAVGSCSFRSECSKEDAENYSQSQTSSIYGSQISSWVEQGHNMKHNSSVSTAYSKRPDEVSKGSRKRLKPGENPRPRPKDRQMIQDRVKELREIVPNGAKCSIDALLERTIKHMLFLQSVTKHADKLKQTGESKIISKEGGLLLKDNFEGGATWAYEVGSQSMVCPIIVEDLNPPRQMLVEMLCEERGLFLEIADIIRGLGLTILKGVMETQNDKIWARFAVEANRDVTRMEIFLSLVRLLEQTVKSSAASVNGIDNDNMMVQSFHQAASIPATGRPCSLQ